MEVIDLAVEDDPDCPVLVADWLPTARKIDNGESTMPERHGAVCVEPLVVRTSMTDGARHAPDDRWIDEATWIDGNYPADPAHD
jgi:hypothetical protein